MHKGLLAGLPEKLRQKFCNEIYPFARERNRRLLEVIEQEQELTPEVETSLDEIMAAFFAAAEQEEDE